MVKKKPRVEIELTVGVNGDDEHAELALVEELRPGYRRLGERSLSKDEAVDLAHRLLAFGLR